MPSFGHSGPRPIGREQQIGHQRLLVYLDVGLVWLMHRSSSECSWGEELRAEEYEAPPPSFINIGKIITLAIIFLLFHSTYKFSIISSYTFLAFRTLPKCVSSFHALLWAHRYLAPYQHLVIVVRNNARLWDKSVMSTSYYWQFHDIFTLASTSKDS
jgi:hypothetical protein